MRTPAFDGGDDACRRRTPADNEKTMIDLPQRLTWNDDHGLLMMRMMTPTLTIIVTNDDDRYT